MKKNSPSFWTTSISSITPEEIYIRGYPMQDLIGRLPFSAIAFLILRGQLPTPGEARMMDVICCSILDYGLQKSATIAARAVVSVNPQMTAGLSAGVLGAGIYAVSPEPTGAFIVECHAAYQASGENLETFAAHHVAELRAAKRRVPGFGHPIFRGADPRAERLKSFAKEFGVWGEMNELYNAIHVAFRIAANKPDLAMNDVGMLAGIMAQMEFAKEMEGVAILSTFPGLIAHVSEEMRHGAINRIVPDASAEYAPTRETLQEDLAQAGWT